MAALPAAASSFNATRHSPQPHAGGMLFLFDPDNLNNSRTTHRKLQTLCTKHVVIMLAGSESQSANTRPHVVHDDGLCWTDNNRNSTLCLQTPCTPLHMASPDPLCLTWGITVMTGRSSTADQAQLSVKWQRRAAKVLTRQHLV